MKDSEGYSLSRSLGNAALHNPVHSSQKFYCRILDAPLTSDRTVLSVGHVLGSYGLVGTHDGSLTIPWEGEPDPGQVQVHCKLPAKEMGVYWSGK